MDSHFSNYSVTGSFSTTAVVVQLLSHVPDGSDSKESACNTGDLGLIPWSERFPEEGNGYPLQYSCLENSIDREEPGGLQSMGSQRVRYDWVITRTMGYLLLKTYRVILSVWHKLIASDKAEYWKFHSFWNSALILLSMPRRKSQICAGWHTHIAFNKESPSLNFPSLCLSCFIFKMRETKW